ncbi:hypothetical protein POKO110462_00430 [Pontibacter korlensis]|uniref:Uncharacterized protein n=1 Tax=Pontibacter korlensis TaxID=400092 RepID=A0A0E3UVT0_9BACT|nr:hypothetical protein [Pontibacter korlensis]AKD02747.1 hypothetical protein PKOR_05960 [Pontibacter korlensis]
MIRTKNLLPLILCLLLGYTAFGQTSSGQGRYFIQLQDGRIVYADKLQYKSPIFKSNHFLLDDSLKYNPSMVSVFQNEDGFFARVEAGSRYDAFAKRLTDGPRIDRFYTTRTYYDGGGYGYSPYGYGYGYGMPRTSRKRIYFFSKDNGPLYIMNYDNLETALADNASSMALLRRYKKDKLINTGVSIVGAGLLAVGAVKSINDSQEINGTTNLKVSPLMYAGAGILGAQLVINLFQKDKLTQAMEVYNYQLKQ